MALSKSVTDYGTTKRIVVIIDLNGTSPRKNVLAFIDKLLSFSPFSSPLSPTLFAYKFFFSSLSPFLSSAKLSAPFHSLSFDLPHFPPLSPFQNLESSFCSSPPQAANIAACLRQIICDYPWDPPETSVSASVSSSLVLLFSPLPKSTSAMSVFLNAELSRDSDYSITSSFCSLFQTARKAYKDRDIHFSWIDTSVNDIADFDFSELKNIFRVMGWGYGHLATITDESVVIPFELIYPSIGISPWLPTVGDCKDCPQVTLITKDSWQKHYCNVELVRIGVASSVMNLNPNRISRINVKAVEISQRLIESGYTFSDQFLLKEHSSKDSIKGQGNNIASAWQLLLLFLYKRSLIAIVCFNDEKGETFTGVMKPFTTTSALISAIDDKKPVIHVKSKLDNFHVDLEDICLSCDYNEDEKIELLSYWLEQVGEEVIDNAEEVSEKAKVEKRLFSDDHKVEEAEHDEKRPWDRLFSSISTYVKRIWAPKMLDFPETDSATNMKRRRTNIKVSQFPKKVRFK